MKRRAYIGLSSPTAYFYDHNQEYFKQPWRWNPILESPQGLVTLFDELWFLSRPLCPVSLRKESYVKFLDEDSDFIPLIKKLAGTLYVGRWKDLLIEYPFINDVIDVNNHYSSEQFIRYRKIIEYVYGRKPGNGVPIDNHSQAMNLCGFNINGDSMKLNLIAFDIAFLGSAGIKNIELITNSFNSVAFKSKPKTIEATRISQGITIKRIPVLQTPRGPIIERIESIRENNFLVDFRQKVLTSNNPDNYIDLVQEIEKEFHRYRNDLLLRKQKESRLATSIGNNSISFLIGSFIPGIGEVKSLISDAAARDFNWTGFIAELESA